MNHGRLGGGGGGAGVGLGRGGVMLVRVIQHFTFDGINLSCLLRKIGQGNVRN